MFADDANLFYTNKNIKILFETVRKERHFVNEWFMTKKLSFHLEKLNICFFFHKWSARDSIPLKLPIVAFNSIKIKRESLSNFL